MTTLLLTGTSGLVGSRLVPRLARSGHHVRALVRRDQGLPPAVTAIQGDLQDPSSLRQAVAGVDAIVHLAALFRTEDQDAVWRTNLDGTRNLVDAVVSTAPDARFIMASTGNVYNADAERPALEADACSPTAAYPASKLAAEQILQESGLTWSILRLPFVYGDGDGHLAALGDLAGQFGLHPAHTYSVVHHRDVATAVQLALSGVMDGKIVNVADDAPVTVYEMTLLGGNPVAGGATPLEHPWSGRMDASLSRQLGFQPKVPTILAAAREAVL